MKKFISIIIGLIMILSSQQQIFAKTEMRYITSTKISKQNNLVILNGNYPIISNLSNATFEANVNARINEIIENNMKSYSTLSQKSLSLSFDIIENNDIMSIILSFKNIMTSEVILASVNINTSTNKFVSINNILGSNGINYANKVVDAEASNLNISYKKVTNSTPFYMKNNNIYVMYGAGELTFPQNGNIVFEVISNNIKNYQISHLNSYEKSKYNVKMVPLRFPLENFGYTLTWNTVSNSINIYKDGKFLSYLVMGKNRYSNSVNRFIRQLEFAPEIKNGVAYVPISYFNQVLDMLFAVDDMGNVVISTYKI